MIVHPPYRAIARLVDHVLTTTREIDEPAQHKERYTGKRAPALGGKPPTERRVALLIGVSEIRPTHMKKPRRSRAKGWKGRLNAM